jgi:hypothetical protein
MKSNMESVDKIDVEDLIKDFKILNIDNFQAYLKEVWRVNEYLIYRIWHNVQMIKLRE